jgi:hypothetical protein
VAKDLCLGRSRAFERMKKTLLFFLRKYIYFMDYFILSPEWPFVMAKEGIIYNRNKFYIE